MPGDGGIRFQSRPEAVAEELRRAILTGALKPGDRLVEQRLAAQFMIGQPTVREALKDLELQGFVRKNSKKHTFVTLLTRDDFRDISEVRLALEVVAVERAATRLTAEAARELEALADRMQAAADALDLARFHDMDLLFHRKVWDVSGNQHLAVALERVASGLFAFVLLQRSRDGGCDFRASAQQHRAMLSGLRSGDPKVARDSFLENTVRFWREFHGIDAGAC